MSQVCDVHHKWRLLTKQNERLKKKIATAADKAEVTVNEELHNAIVNENKSFFEDLPSDSFQRIFWEQQVQAASCKSAKNMRWHPIMIRWCLYLRHRLAICDCINIIV